MINKKFLVTITTSLMAFLVIGCGGHHPRTSFSYSNESSSQSESSSSSRTSSSSTTNQNSSSNQTNTHVVRFYHEGALYGDPVEVQHGHFVSKPDIDPVKASDENYDYIFEGWDDINAQAPYDFTKPVVSDLSLQSVFRIENRCPYDLVVYINGGISTTYVTEEESNAVLTSFRQQQGVRAEANILWERITTMNTTSFAEYATNSDYPADFVIAGNNIDTFMGTDSEYGKAPVGNGWFANTTRRMIITERCRPDHRDLAIILYNMLLSEGPNAE